MLRLCAVSGKHLIVFFKKWGVVYENVYTQIAGLNSHQPDKEPSTLNN